jgi:hypothetical protein
MNRMVRLFSKRYYLPLKWRLEKWAEAYGVEYPHPRVLQQKHAELEQDLLKAKQEGRNNDASTITGMLKMLKYVLEYEHVQGEKDVPQQPADSDQA